jgi:HSP20 family molecular chaperone IbpA
MLPAAMARRLTIRLQPLSGTVERFYAFVDCKKRIAADGTEAASWSGDVPDDEAVVKVRVFGVGKAKYRVSIDLPGTADDQNLDLWLDQGYGELELRI